MGLPRTTASQGRGLAVRKPCRVDVMCSQRIKQSGVAFSGDLMDSAELHFNQRLVKLYFFIVHYLKAADLHWRLTLSLQMAVLPFVIRWTLFAHFQHASRKLDSPTICWYKMSSDMHCQRQDTL